MACNNVTGVMRKFGEVLRTLYSKTSEYRKADYSIKYLGLAKYIQSSMLSSCKKNWKSFITLCASYHDNYKQPGYMFHGGGHLPPLSVATNHIICLNQQF